MMTKMMVLTLAGFLFFTGTVACQKEGASEPNEPTPVVDPIDNQPTGEGTAWLTGAVDPGPDLGKEADFYIQTVTGDLYRRVQGVWNKLLPMKGAVGATGAQGVAGPAGADGAMGPQGAAGPQGVPGAKGDKGDKGLTGDKGATGAVGATGAQGVAGPAGAKGDRGEKGDKGDAGLNGLGANVIALFADHLGKEAVYAADRALKVTIPNSLVVLYGTGAAGTAYVSIGKKVICSYQAGSVNQKDPPPGTEDYELGKRYRLVQCANQKAEDYELDVQQADTVYSVNAGETIRLTVATAGTRISGARVAAIFGIAQ